MIFLGAELGKDKYPYIVAEISCNHEGDIIKAKRLIDAAKDAGADAVKIQVYTADDMTIDDPNKDFYTQEGPWAGRHLYYLYKKTQTNFDLADKMLAYAKSINIPMFASVFSQKGLSWLELSECPAYKIASFELPDINLIRKVAKTGKPIILSTGMASLEEIDMAVQCCNPENLILLHCTSVYPTQISNANLWRIPYLQNFYKSPIGFSDHTKGVMAGQLACAAGARMLEKHLYLGETTGEPTEDADFSLTPAAFKFYTKACRAAAAATFKTTDPDEETSRQFRRSLYVVRDVKEGEAFTPSNVRSIRPSYGLSCHHYSKVIMSRATMDIQAGTALKKEHVL